MSKTKRRRKRLFEVYSDNLDFLVKNKIIRNPKLKEKQKYICPICLDPFSEDDLDEASENRLTLEDAPPKSLKGSQIALTCARCNNGMGQDIDWHLSERLNELDFKDRVEGAVRIGTFTLNGLTVNGEVQVHKNGVTKVFHSKKNNNPKKLQQYIDSINKNKNESPIFTPKPSRVDPKKLQIALLKTAYILMFEKFGYAFLMDKEYERIREQLKYPESNVYPLKCWFHGGFPEERIGIPFIMEKDLESIFVLFKLETRLSSRLFAVVLPLTSKPIEEIIEELENRFDKEKNFEIDMMSFDDDDYLRNIESINLLLNWMKKFKEKWYLKLYKIIVAFIRRVLRIE